MLIVYVSNIDLDFLQCLGSFQYKKECIRAINLYLKTPLTEEQIAVLNKGGLKVNDVIISLIRV